MTQELPKIDLDDWAKSKPALWRAWVWIKERWWLVVMAASVFAAYVFSRRQNWTTSIDSIQTESRRRVDAEKNRLQNQAQLELKNIETKRADELAQVQGDARVEYTEVRKKGSNEVAKWLNDFSKERNL